MFMIIFSNTTTLLVHHAFFVHSFAVVARLLRESASDFAFFGGRELLFLNFDTSHVKNSPPEKIAKASCKRNIKATFLSIELVFLRFPYVDSCFDIFHCNVLYCKLILRNKAYHCLFKGNLYCSCWFKDVMVVI